MKHCIAICLALLAFSLAAFAQQETPAGKDELRKKLEHAVQVPTSGGFWGAVLVAKNDEILLARGYGDADYAGTRNTEKTLFEIASTSKIFTAAGILKLEMLGKLSTDDPITKFFNNVPDDKVLNAKAKKKCYTPFKNNYACGCMVEKTESRGTKVYHTGGVAGFRSILLKDPKKRASIASTLMTQALAKSTLSDMIGMIDAKRAAGQDDKAEADMEAGVYIQQYDPKKAPLVLSEGIQLRLMEKYVGRTPDGQEVVDDRITFIIVDNNVGQWPVMVLMNRSAAKKLADVLRAVAGD